MIKKLSSLSHKTLFIILILLVAVGIGIHVRGNDKSSKAGYPEYLNFAGNYVFSVPKDYSVDEQSVPGAQLVYTGTISAKTVEDVYSANGMAISAVGSLTDHSSKAFKDYIKGTFTSDLKKNLSTSDVKVKFGKTNGADNAQASVSKDGKLIRFVFLKGGQHPAQVVAKSETSNVKIIESTMKDVESSNLKAEADPLRKAITNVAQLVKDQKAAELYNAAAPSLRTENSQEDLNQALKTAAQYTVGNMTISGGNYTPDQFQAAVRFTPLDSKNQQPTFGAMSFKKIDGQWKLEALSLPTPK